MSLPIGRIFLILGLSKQKWKIQKLNLNICVQILTYVFVKNTFENVFEKNNIRHARLQIVSSIFF